MQVVKGFSMEKWLCWGAIGVAGVMGLLFLLDFFVGQKMGFPFGKISPFVDILGILSCGIVGYLGWDALQDLH
jgi:hypothetical protein